MSGSIPGRVCLGCVRKLAVRDVQTTEVRQQTASARSAHRGGGADLPIAWCSVLVADVGSKSSQEPGSGYDFHRPAPGATHLSPLKARQSSGMAAPAEVCLQTQEPGWNHHKHKDTHVFLPESSNCWQPKLVICKPKILRPEKWLSS